MIQAELLRELADWCPDLDADSVVAVGSGAEAHVFRGRLRDGRPVAVKVARAATLSTGNDPDQDICAYLRQEAALARHLVTHGVPVPEPIAANTTGDGPVFLVSEYIDADASEPDAREVGQVLGRIHTAPVPDLDLVCMEGHQDLDDVLAKRVPERLARLDSTYHVEIEPPLIGDALAASPPPAGRSLLHMDYRRANWLVSCGRLQAVVDWSNALIGDPDLDLARSAETQAIGQDAVAAYMGPADFHIGSADPRHLVYRLDAAVMLAHVFLSSGEHALAQHYLRRCNTLSAYLAR